MKHKSKIVVFGIITMNHLGQIMGASTYLEFHVADVFIAKAKAYEKAILFAIDMEFSCGVVLKWKFLCRKGLRQCMN